MTGQKSSRVFCCVDDNGETCVRLSGELNRRGARGYDVICARDAQSALWWSSNERFDLYILGHQFPENEGLEFFQRLKELAPHAPIIFYVEDEGDPASKGLPTGAQAYLVSPNAEELAITVLRLLGDQGLVAA